MEKLARMVAAQIPQKPVDRCAAMVERYGEACSIAQACAAMNLSRTTVYRLLRDGKIGSACEGMRIDVRSMAAYMDRVGGD